MNNVRITVESINQLSNILSNQNSLLRLKYERFMIAFKIFVEPSNMILRTSIRFLKLNIA